VPDGKRLVTTYEQGELRVDLCDLPDGTPPTPCPVPVPERVARYHPVVAEFRKASDRLEIGRSQVTRVARLLQGLVAEAERRGYVVEGPLTGARLRRGGALWSGDVDGHLRITVDGATVTLRLREDGIRGRTVYPRRLVTDWPYDPFPRATPAYDSEAKGTVRISIVGPASRSQRVSSWGDGKRRRLEDVLAAVLWEVEVRAADVRRGL
jgi:hypothetical protein